MEAKVLLAVGEIYHVFSRSIAGFKVFNDDDEFLRMVDALRYYQSLKPPIRFSKLGNGDRQVEAIKFRNNNERLVNIIAYCLMPTHIHLVLKQLKQNGISTFMNNILNSYTRYFNIKHNRKGPLWESRFKRVLVNSDEQLIHLTRYVHLNPVTAYLINKPQEWIASSYKEYLLEISGRDRICKYDGIINVEPSQYKNFTEDIISYYRQLAKIKSLAID